MNPGYPSLDNIIRDLDRFAETGAGFWRISELALPAFDKLHYVVSSARRGGRPARFLAIEELLGIAARSHEPPWDAVACLHLGFDAETRAASHIRSRTARENLAAGCIKTDGRSYRREVASLRDGRYRSWREKTLTRTAEALLVLDANYAPERTLPDKLLVAGSGVAGVYPTQDVVQDEIRDLARTSTEIDILAIRGLGIVGLTDSLLRGTLLEPGHERQLRVLYLAAGSDNAARRADEIGESVESFNQGISLGISKLREMMGRTAHAVELYIYDELPIWRIIRLDETMYVSTYVPGKEGQSSQMFKIVRQSGAVLFEAYLRVIEAMLSQATPVASKDSAS